jgi:membrane protein required for colicin V production
MWRDEMNWLDIVIVVIAIIFGVLGLWQGAIRTIFGLAGLIAGIALAGHYYQGLASILFPGEASWAAIAAYAIILIATLIIVGVIGWLVARLAHIAMLGWLDKVIGFILGAGIGAMLCAALLAIVSKYLPGTEELISQSVMAKLLMERFPLLLALLPEEFDFIGDFFSPSP